MPLFEPFSPSSDVSSGTGCFPVFVFGFFGDFGFFGAFDFFGVFGFFVDFGFVFESLYNGGLAFLPRFLTENYVDCYCVFFCLDFVHGRTGRMITCAILDGTVRFVDFTDIEFT